MHIGRDPAQQHGAVNPPVYRTSTVLFESVAKLRDAAAGRLEKGRVYYGRLGTPTTFSLEDAVAELEQGYAGIAVPSGLAAIAGALVAFTAAGDHILVSDAVYGPVRRLCDGLLARFGVATSYYDPHVGAAIADLIRPQTRVVFVEAPGSLTFE
ncbi:MAG: cystathionine beta-lyase, partial [Alphaproteobacteria bacterium]